MTASTGKRVLVIEDSLDNLRLITYPLKEEGYEVIAAADGEKGVVLALAERPLFILLDINLPGIDGLEVTRRIRESAEGSTIPIIAITSYAMAGDEERILAAGCNGYFEKPIDPETIIQSIHRLLGLGERQEATGEKP